MKVIHTTSKHNVLITVPNAKRRSDKNLLFSQKVHEQVPESARVRKIKTPLELENVTLSKSFEGPCSNNEVLTSYKHYITSREEYEISNYPIIYYIRKAPIILKKSDTTMPNLLRFEKDEHIAYRYQMISILGEGSSGFVIKCHDHRLNEDVAIKALRDTRKSHNQVLLEKNYLVKLQQNGGPDKFHIIRYKDSFMFRGYFCLVMELASINIYSTICAQPFKRLQATTFQMVARQTAEALDFMHKNSVIHSDIKPENILFTNLRRTSVKLIDFGCSCTQGNTLYTYIQSRYYRAPEVVLENEYDCKIDIWSYGCLLCEMYTGKPLFEAYDEEELMSMMISMLGIPPKSILETAKRAKYYFDEDFEPLESLDIKEVSLKGQTNISDPYLLQLISGCLRWDPQDRFTTEDILKHNYFKHSNTSSKNTGYMRT